MDTSDADQVRSVALRKATLPLVFAAGLQSLQLCQDFVTSVWASHSCVGMTILTHGCVWPQLAHCTAGTWRMGLRMATLKASLPLRVRARGVPPRVLALTLRDSRAADYRIRERFAAARFLSEVQLPIAMVRAPAPRTAAAPALMAARPV